MAELPEPEDWKKKKYPALYGKRSNHYRLEREEFLKDETGDFPGPGKYFGPDSAGFASLGMQRFSANRTEPSLTICKTGWKNWDKVFITAGHRPATAGDAPGPGTYRDWEKLSTLDVGSGVAFTKGNRFNRRSYGSISPGPKYDVRSRHAKDFSTENHKTIKFPLAKRFASGERPATVGPGQYERGTLPWDHAIVTHEEDPMKGRSLGLGFSAYKKVICPGWEKVGQGALSPGPGPPVNWRDRIKTGRPVSMTRAKRFREKSIEAVPGPGQYSQELVNDKFQSSIASIRSAPQVGFGRACKHPRFRQKLSLNCKNGAWGYF